MDYIKFVLDPARRRSRTATARRRAKKQKKEKRKGERLLTPLRILYFSGWFFSFCGLTLFGFSGFQFFFFHCDNLFFFHNFSFSCSWSCSCDVFICLCIIDFSFLFLFSFLFPFGPVPFSFSHPTPPLFHLTLHAPSIRYTLLPTNFISSFLAQVTPPSSPSLPAAKPPFYFFCFALRPTPCNLPFPPLGRRVQLPRGFHMAMACRWWALHCGG